MKAPAGSTRSTRTRVRSSTFNFFRTRAFPAAKPLDTKTAVAVFDKVWSAFRPGICDVRPQAAG